MPLGKLQERGFRLGHECLLDQDHPVFLPFPDELERLLRMGKGSRDQPSWKVIPKNDLPQLLRT